MDEVEKQKLIGKLTDFHKELKSYKKLLSSEKQLSESQKRYRDALREGLVRKIGGLKDTIIQLTGKQFYTQFGTTRNFWADGLMASGYSPVREDSLDFCIDTTNEAIGKLESTTITELELQEVRVAEPPKAFIAHEGETKALAKLTEFLIALKINPIIAEKMPSDSSLVEPHVGSNIHKGDFVIILATKGKAINKKTKKPYMGLNVADELGRAREANMKVILLLEKGVDPHTNISGIAWANFIPQSMDEAFTKIVRELTNWGFITAGTIKGATP